MINQNNANRTLSEPMYDDEMLQQIEKQQTEALVAGLIDYCARLEKDIVGLRRQVNQLTQSGNPEPYPDLHGDIYETFADYEAYPEFAHLFAEAGIK